MDHILYDNVNLKCEKNKLFCSEHNAFNGRFPVHFKVIFSGISRLLCLKSHLSTECLLFNSVVVWLRHILWYLMLGNCIWGFIFS